MPNGWFGQSVEARTFLASEDGQKRIAEWKKDNPGVWLPIGMQQIWDEEEASKCKKM